MKNIAIVTKSLINKSNVNNQNIKNNSFFVQMKIDHLEFGQKILKIANKYFSNISLYSLDNIHDLFLKKNLILNSFDIVITLGGDGTFLGCSHYITNSNVLLLGINSNSKKSIGFLLQTDLNNFEKDSNLLFKNLIDNNFKILKRKRFITKLCSFNNEIIGLNDFFLGLTNQTSASLYEFKNMSGIKETIRSSGLLIYTGTGSTSFAKAINRVSKNQLNTILNNLNINMNEIEKIELLTKIENESIFNANQPILKYIHRELYKINYEILQNGEGNKFEIVNLKSNAYIGIDGFEYKINLNEKINVNLANENLDLSCIELIK